ncbi:hypothetical protein AXG93_4486s1030 [Marchantia polymorpha subsp. ruderalis]|uniref:Uncharacterized protein n=1 Tax=Marchantia polymorpha subsp. ruderalis TaxID=1480154 RepID=A0A176WAS3_MARPO|nr:hypothetical protein AXG93_4486s1030 [Marchantia polymorpha subsp. ruderalis]
MPTRFWYMNGSGCMAGHLESVRTWVKRDVTCSMVQHSQRLVARRMTVRLGARSVRLGHGRSGGAHRQQQQHQQRCLKRMQLEWVASVCGGRHGGEEAEVAAAAVTGGAAEMRKVWRLLDAEVMPPRREDEMRAVL